MSQTNQSKNCFTTQPLPKPTYCEFGIPVQKGAFAATDILTLIGRTVNGQEKALDCHITTHSTWPDGRAKWLKVGAVLEGDLICQLARKINTQDSVQEPKRHLSLNQTTVNTTGEAFQFLLSATLIDGKTLNLQPVIEDKQLNPVNEKINIQFEDAHYDQLRFHLTVSHCPTTLEYALTLRVENTEKALHPDGTWDLGDPNSQLFESLDLIIEHVGAEHYGVQIVDGLKNTFHAITDTDAHCKVTQDSSGGKQSDSPIHATQTGEIAYYGQGFSVYSKQVKTSTGLRANPTIKLQINNITYVIQAQYFWQNFPCSVETNTARTRFQFLTKSAELQPGESKSFSIKIAPQSSNTEPSLDLFETPIQFNRDYLNQSNILPYAELNDTTGLSQLLLKGIKGEHSFFQKRESVDVYGWRNFGELYADHEAANQKDSGYFVSHYNNQYDALYGLLLQHLTSPHLGWNEIALPLAQHVSDIDIYNTKLDRAEYNGGLFWHTDHYLPVETCTHRTYSSKHHSVYEGHQGGGGPGGQHCYTTGLLLHGLLYGQDQSLAKVKQLSDWIRHFYNGNGSILDRLYRFLTIDSKHDSLTNIGIIKKGFRYPLDRGTGNYLTALIDCYEVTQDPELIKEMGFVIKNTVGVGEDISERNLQDVENAWFYTVFLQALIKFLLLKETLNQLNDEYHYAKAVLKEYALWMLVNETPYLSKPDILEFPNDTWAAQDLRKAVIFAYAAYFIPSHADGFNEKAQYYSSYVIAKLTNSEETHTTRILAILMQNFGAIEKAKWYQKNRLVNSTEVSIPSYRGQNKVRRLLTDLLKLLPKLSVRREINWLRSRLNKRALTLKDTRCD